MIKVLLVDNERMVRVGLRMILEQDEDIQVINEASDYDSARDSIFNSEYDVALLDLDLGSADDDGFKLLSELNELHIFKPILVYSHLSEDTFFPIVMNHGAAGFLSKDNDDDLILAVKTVAKNNIYMTRSQTELMKDSYGHRDPAKVKKLFTKTEIKVLQMLLKGFSQKDIAEKWGRKKQAINTHVTNIRRKLNCENDIQVGHFLAKSGILE